MREVYSNVIRDSGKRKLEVMSNHGEENSGLAQVSECYRG